MCPIGSAVLTFIAFKRADRQTNKQSNINISCIVIFIIIFVIVIVIIITHYDNQNFYRLGKIGWFFSSKFLFSHSVFKIPRATPGTSAEVNEIGRCSTLIQLNKQWYDIDIINVLPFLHVERKKSIFDLCQLFDFVNNIILTSQTVKRFIISIIHYLYACL